MKRDGIRSQLNHRKRGSAADEEYHQQVSRQEVLSTLRAQQAVLHARFGVTRLALFGSVARDEAGQDSDVDLLVDLPEGTSLFAVLALEGTLERILKVKVDLAPVSSLKPRVRVEALADAVAL